MAASALRRSCGTCCNGKFRLLRVHRSSDNESLRTNTHPLKWTGSLNSLSRRLDQGVFQYPNLLSNGSTHHCLEARAPDVFTQCVVDQGLIVATARTIHGGLNVGLHHCRPASYGAGNPVALAVRRGRLGNKCSLAGCSASVVLCFNLSRRSRAI